MGSVHTTGEETVEFNDTLALTKEQGFPDILNVDYHLRVPHGSLSAFGTSFTFRKEGNRIYHNAPTPTTLVEKINGAWVYWGEAHVTSQRRAVNQTDGTYEIVKIYPPDVMIMMTVERAPLGRSYFHQRPTSFTPRTTIEVAKNWERWSTRNLDV